MSALLEDSEVSAVRLMLKFSMCGCVVEYNSSAATWQVVSILESQQRALLIIAWRTVTGTMYLQEAYT